MKTAILGALAAMLCAASGLRLDFTNYTFESYVSEFGKTTYSAAEHKRHAATFEENRAFIVSQNMKYAAGQSTWYAGVNKFTDMTQAEVNKFKGYDRAEGYSRALHKLSMPETVTDVSGLPTHIDWRTSDNPKGRNVVTPVKDQGGCGSCWSFSSAETIESMVAINTGTLLVLSEQQLVSCAPDPGDCGGSGGCEGNIQEWAFSYVHNVSGITTEADWPYTGQDDACDTSLIKPAATVTGYVELPVNDYNALLSAVATIGPMAISAAADAWQFYGGGVFSDSCGFVVDHAIQAVGYGVDGTTPYWTVRNSWGSGWGEGGYIRILRGDASKKDCGTDSSPSAGDGCAGGPDSITVCGECGILSDTSYPTGAKLA